MKFTELSPQADCITILIFANESYRFTGIVSQLRIWEMDMSMRLSLQNEHGEKLILQHQLPQQSLGNVL